MVKQFFSDSLSGMTFTFSFVILLNAILGLFQGVNQWNNPGKHIVGLAFLILVLWAMAYGVSYLEFRSIRAYHLFNFSSQLIVFFVAGNLIGLISITLDSIISNGVIAVIIYFSNNQLRKQQVKRLAYAINRHLTQKEG